ncbi:MAG: formate dehydrogenase accessory sulfurtransferase FdhD [Sphingobium sp.]|uniref:formate dehydrogenase accessory sulfurtransferase FdhD n=1 Tax=Sphingobium sp. TaxID=1912891 RepID=UPI000DAF50AA|nr:formate dehydrogenase accessory sulfurtransferase FdhD [Sphingobium sp.]PZU12090.1 MAG: formate dehydrogenase accessory sulfurtransferase FdhD [Sphingobium sp.]
MHKPDPAPPSRFSRVDPAGSVASVDRPLADEVPVAIEYNGIGYAVLMATPTDLSDLVTGFALAERLLGAGDAALDADLHDSGAGIVARATLPQGRTDALLDRVRHRATDSSCGLCGIENLDQAIRPLPPVTTATQADRAAIFRAIGGLRDHQPLNGATGAAHAAALAGPDGSIRMAREDVGRHNAFDKLIGAMRRQKIGWDGGFALLSSRCSYELVEKAVLAGCPLLVTLSAPTRLAAQRAREAGLPIVVLARSDAVLAQGIDLS